MNSVEKPVAVIGGGLVGCVQAIFLANRGSQVELYESRQDIRKSTAGQGRSINLTIADRGRAALSAIGCEQEVVAMCVPVNGRMIHSQNSKMTPQPYSIKDDAILSIHRLKFNEYLLNKAEAHPNIKVYFQHKLIRANLKEQILTFDYNGTEKKVHVAFTFGCDGAHSAVRREFMQLPHFNYNQEYVDHGYKELSIPATIENEYAMPPNSIHIWPKQDFMLLALPNQDKKTFTVTLFMPKESFDSIKSKEDVLAFFNEHFPDSIDKIGADHLVNSFFNNPTGSLLSIKCSPYYLDSHTVILGDAAHAMVPFYGQGVNAGLEDCLIFNECLEQVDGDLHKAAQTYSNLRWKSCHAITDMSMYNYLVLRSQCTSRLYRLKKYIDNWLYWLFPNSFIPIYSMVAFSRIPYHEVIEKDERQKAIVNWGLATITIVVVSVIIAFVLLFASLLF